MKILILGGNGMIGHNFFQSWKNKYEVKVTLKQRLINLQKLKLFSFDNSYENINVFNIRFIEDIINKFSPNVVVNCIGITKQLTDQMNPIPSILINSLFPNQLAKICEKFNSRLILLSTDCIFSGKKGFYKEKDVSDAQDLYGRSKFLGEVNKKNVLTLRKSSIGLEISNQHGLVEWFISQTGSIKGYTRAIYSGLTTKELANVVESIIINYPSIHGIYNVASKPISKFSLLKNLNKRLKKNNIDVIPDSKIVCDRSLDNAKFFNKTGYSIPSWEIMLDNLARDINDQQ